MAFNKVKEKLEINEKSNEINSHKCYCVKSEKVAQNYLTECGSGNLLFEKRIDFKLQLILHHHVFNEQEAAFYCRTNVESIRYHALRSRKLTFCDFSKGGLVFLKTDLDNFLHTVRKESYRS